MRWLLVLAMSLVGAEALLAGDARVERNVPYAGSDDPQRGLDIYAPQQGEDHPIVLWIHGGGWSKGNKARVQEKPKAFVDRGCVFVSIGYRLMPRVKSPAEQAGDIATAIAWIHKHAKEYGGSPEKMFVMGHSAGAHLAALVCVDGAYLKQQGLSLANIAGCVPVDTAVYDIPAQAAAVGPLRGKLYSAAFGDDPAGQKKLSPLTHVAAGKKIPPFLILHVADRPDSTRQSRAFAKALEAAGVKAQVVAGEGKTHATINRELGKPGDKPTQAVFSFLNREMKSGAVQRLDPAFALVQRAVADGRVPGAIALVAQDGKLVRQEAFGVCDQQQSRPMKTDTICWLASITKPITVATALRLVDEGQLSLDDTVETYLPEFKRQQGPGGKHEPITIRQLMSHASGIQASPPLRPRNFFEPLWLGRSISEVAPAIAKTPLEFKPGEKTQYSNAAPYVLGRIIELRSGQPFGERVRRTILQPLGMIDTDFVLAPTKAKRVAVVYRRSQGKQDTFFRFDPEWKVNMSMPDGGLFAPVGDVAKFAQMFLENDGRVLSKKSVTAMLTRQSSNWGLGWSLGDDGSFEHTGSAGTLVWGNPRTQVIGALFFQIQDPNTVQPLRDRFRKAVASAMTADKAQPNR